MDARELTEHQIGFLREISRDVLKEVLSEALAGEMADRIAECARANAHIFRAIGSADDYRTVRETVRKG